MPSTTESTVTTSLQALAIERLQWSRSFVNTALEATPDELMLTPPSKDGNHPIWVMGHIAQSEDQLHALCTGEPMLLDKQHHTLFGSGTTPVTDAGIYPDRETLAKRMQTTHKQTLRWAESMTTDELAHKPTPKQVQTFAPTHIGTIGAHELMHLGQVTSTRTGAGLPPALA